MPLKLLTLALLLLLGIPACGSSEEPTDEASEADLEGEGEATETWIPEGHEWVGDWNSLVQEVQRDLSHSSGGSLSNLEFLVSDPKRVGRVLESNIRARLPEGTDLPISEAERDQLAHGLIGIFDLDNKVVHISLETFETMSKLLGVDDFTSREVVYAVMVHEGCHALIDRNHDLTDFFRTAQANGAEAVEAADAVSEGYAQHLARATCARTQRTRGFETFCRAITQLPEDMDPGARLLAEQAVRPFGFAYGDGEEFVARVLDELGAAGEDRLFDRPPLTRIEVLRPEWYLEPESKPAHEFAIGEALALVPPAFDEIRDMSFVRRELAGSDIADGNRTALGDAQADAMGNLIEFCEVQIGLTPGGERMVMVGLTIFPDEAAADRFLQFARRASDIKDEQLKASTTLQIIASKTTEVDADLGIGIRQVKTVEALGRSVPVSSLMVRRGRLMIELTLSNVEQSETEANALARSLFAVALYED